MRRIFAWRALAAAGAIIAMLVFGVGKASAFQFHGIAFNKGCESPTTIGSPYACAYLIQNTVDTGHDTEKITGLSDVAHTAGGDQSSGNILSSLQLVFSSPTVTCIGGSGGGTNASPYVGATSCTLPFGTNIQSMFFSYYTVQPGDFGLPNQQLTDTATLSWNNTCTAPGIQNCTTNAQHASAGSSSEIDKLDSSTATAIHDAAHNTVTIVAAGTTVHDFITVTGTPGHPAPSGNVSLAWYANGTCTDPPAATKTESLDASGQADATDFSQTPSAAGFYSFRATYGGDPSYNGSTGPCEPLTVVDANIQITPNGVNPVGSPHVFTAHVNVNDGNGFVPAPDGTAISFTIDNGPGSFTTPNPCTTTGGTGSCTITLTSSQTGVTTVSAHTTLSVGGVTLTRNTDGTGANSGPATKTWVDANIQISPPTATNAVGTNHVLTITVNAIGGTIDAGPHTATASIVSGPGSFVGSPSCTYTGGGASASCTVTITSAATGTTVVQATSNIPVNGQTIPRTTATNPGPGGSGNASKTWVDANIQISPPTATNPVGTNHVLTITVNAIGGTIDAGLHTATASIVSGPGGFVGSPTCTYTGGAATASCTVTITSSVAGTTVVQATSNIPVNGQTIPRTTATNPGPGGSGNASKTWLPADANIQLTPATATNAVGTNHTLHCHINVSTDSVTYTNAPDGTICTVTITNGPGTPTSQNCTTTAGSCDVVITSNTAGTTTLNASTTVTVNGIVLTRTTDGTAGNSGPATKTWVDANIQIGPPTATNAVGTNHVLTITVNAINGTLANGTATASIVSGPGSFVGSPTCTYTGGAATASCTVTITSSATGTTVVQATSNIPVSGQTITRTTATNPGPGGSGNASKTWVDANIAITPTSANNPIGTNHVLTITVDAINGTLANGTATASIVSGPGTFVGSPTCSYTGGAATASCTVTITSTTTGTTVVSATSSIGVSGQTIVRTTGTSTNTASGGSGNASKNWADDSIVTHVLDASNNDVTNGTVTGGTVVHDTATVTKTAGTPAAVPAPTGTVTFTLYDNGTCNGNLLATDANKPLSGGTATSATFTTPGANGSFSYSATYNGDSNYPAKTAACEPFNVTGTPPGLIAPTQTTCQQYSNGTSPTLGSINYSVGNNGKISQNVNPGVFFYYATIKTTLANQTVTVTQSIQSGAGPLFLTQSAKLLTASCGALSNGNPVSGATGTSFTIATPGTYVIQIKYDSKSISGASAPSPANLTYNFTTSLGGNTGASVQLVKQ